MTQQQTLPFAVIQTAVGKQFSTMSANRLYSTMVGVETEHASIPYIYRDSSGTRLIKKPGVGETLGHCDL